jgi:hypothetical protein
MSFTITFMKVTIRAPKALVARALAKPRKEGIILDALENHGNPIATITGAGLSYLGTGRWRVSGNADEVYGAIHLLTTEQRLMDSEAFFSHQ